MKLRFSPLLIFLLWAILAPIVCHASEAIDEKKAARIKAAYLYYLTLLSEWPETSLPGETDTLRICVIGNDKYGLTDFFRTEITKVTTGQHPLVIDSIRETNILLDGDQKASEILSPYHILFFTQSEFSKYQDILNSIDSSGKLTTSEIEGFSQKGGMVGFVIEGNLIQIEVNHNAVVEAKLKISAEFLQHTKIVE